MMRSQNGCQNRDSRDGGRLTGLRLATKLRLVRLPSWGPGGRDKMYGPREQLPVPDVILSPGHRPQVGRERGSLTCTSAPSL